MAIQDKDPKRNMAFRFRVSMIEQLQAAGKATGLTMTGVIEKCVDGYIDNLIPQVRAEQKVAAKELLDLRKRKK